eukprot:1253513-Pleurochrysis_carterae.AAC.1
MAARATASLSMGARLRKEAKRGGCRRARSTRARTYGSSPGPSAARPPDTASSAVGAAVSAPSVGAPRSAQVACSRASARVAFSSGG